MFALFAALAPAPAATHDTEAGQPSRELRRSLFDNAEEIGTLMPVYTEIARRLSRNAYTSYGATL
ncbi:MAG: hypothetical protein F9K31_05560 [Dokdonella sp.]|nr:MAG: hypothetical protein F9K31_05560 [Dokdonella sp.]